MVGVAVAVGGTGVWLGVKVAVGSGVSLGSGVGVSVGVMVAEGGMNGVGVMVGVSEGVGVMEAVAGRVTDGVGLEVGSVPVGVAVPSPGARWMANSPAQ